MISDYGELQRAQRSNRRRHYKRACVPCVSRDRRRSRIPRCSGGWGTVRATNFFNSCRQIAIATNWNSSPRRRDAGCVGGCKRERVRASRASERAILPITFFFFRNLCFPLLSSFLLPPPSIDDVPPARSLTYINPNDCPPTTLYPFYLPPRVPPDFPS